MQARYCFLHRGQQPPLPACHCCAERAALLLLLLASLQAVLLDVILM